MSAIVVEPRRGTNVGRVFVDVTVENPFDMNAPHEARFGPKRFGGSGSSTCRHRRDAPVPAEIARRSARPDIPALQGAPHRRSDPSVGNLCDGARRRAGCNFNTEAMAIAGDRSPLLGQIPLEMMDWWVDTANQRLVGNPEHGGEWMVRAL